MQINKRTDESLDSTRRMVGMMEESQEAGAKTMEALYKQGEQLENVEVGLDRMGDDMAEAEKQMREIEKCCGLCVCPWNKRQKFERMGEYDKAWTKRNDDGRLDGPSAAMTAGGAPDGRPNTQQPSSSQPHYVNRITNDAREEEMDDNLHMVNGMLGNLKSMAVDMGQELQTQNKQLDRLNTKAEANDTRLEMANKRANMILEKK